MSSFFFVLVFAVVYKLLSPFLNLPLEYCDDPVKLRLDHLSPFLNVLELDKGPQWPSG